MKKIEAKQAMALDPNFISCKINLHFYSFENYLLLVHFHLFVLVQNFALLWILW